MLIWISATGAEERDMRFRYSIRLRFIFDETMDNLDGMSEEVLVIASMVRDLFVANHCNSVI